MPRSEVLAAFTSWRTAAVALQQIPSSAPLGLILIAFPAWLAVEGVDIKTIGWLSLVQAPWTFKFLWSPLMDRFTPGFLGRKRGWAVLAQAALFAATLGLAAAGWGGLEGNRLWVVAVVSFFLAFASASQDIAIDAYAVEVLRPEEQGVAAGARAALGRVAMTLTGRVSITLTAWLAWPAVFAAQALLYVPAAALMVASPEPENVPVPPRTLREAVFDPFVAFLRQHRALEIILFLVLYKFADNLGTALVSPFLLQAGYNEWDVGVGFFAVGLVATFVGSLAGGALTTAIGLGHALWIFGLLQAFSNLGYVAIVTAGVNRPLMYGAMAIEAGTTAMGTGAFSVLLLRLTEKRFSATQYALLSSIFALGRTIAGPLAGVLVDALGWRTFFLITIAFAAPGLLMLQRFVPLGVREPEFRAETTFAGPPLRKRAVLARAVAGALFGCLFGALVNATLAAARLYRADPAAGFDLPGRLAVLVAPAAPGQWIALFGVLAFGASCGLGWAALVVGRRGLRTG